MRRRYVLGAVALVAVSVPAAVFIPPAFSTTYPPGCSALASWWKAAGQPEMSVLAADMGAVSFLDASSYVPLATDAQHDPGYPAGFKAPVTSPANAFTGHWAEFLEDATVGAQLHNTAILTQSAAPLKLATADLKKCGA